MESIIWFHCLNELWIAPESPSVNFLYNKIRIDDHGFYVIVINILQHKEFLKFYYYLLVGFRSVCSMVINVMYLPRGIKERYFLLDCGSVDV